MESFEETFQVETPENVNFGYKVSGIGSRFLAALADTAIIGVILAVVLGAALLVFDVLEVNLFDNSEASAWIFAIFGLITFLFYWGFYIFFEMMWNGQTPGKRWVGLRTIRANGLPITISESITRNLMRIIDMLPALYGAAIVTMFIDNKSRRLGDIAAGTLVVYDRKAITIEALENETRPAIRTNTANIQPDRDFPVKSLSERDIAILEDYLRRRYQLTNRGTMARKMLHLIYSRAGLSVPDISSYIDIESKLASIAVAAREEPPNAAPFT